MGAVPALEAAFALARMPTMAAHMRAGPVPAGVSVLLRIVAGEDGFTESVAQGHGVSEADVRHAAEFYVQQIMLYPGAEPHRVLGLAPRASREEARAHMRRLLLWLHPDRSEEEWRAAFAGRVLEAWRKLSLEPVQAGAGFVPAVSPQSQQSARAMDTRRTPSRRRPKLTWIPIPLPKEEARRSRARLYLLASLVFLAVCLTPNDGPRAVLSAFFPTENPVVEPELRAGINENDEAAEPIGSGRPADPFGTLR